MKNKEMERDYFIYNKIADTQDLHKLGCRSLLRDLLKIKNTLESKGIEYSSHMATHWLRWWEYTRLILYSGVDTRSKVLDAGGTATLFSLYLAFEGCQTHTVDIDEGKVAQANIIAKLFNLPLKNSCQSMTNLNYEDNFFDYVFSVSVIEHLEPEDQTNAMKDLARVLKPGGVFGLTFDYGKDAANNPILSPEEVITRLAEPSGLEIIGNKDFVIKCEDMGNHSLDYTFGSLFLYKPGELSRPTQPHLSFNFT